MRGHLGYKPNKKKNIRSEERGWLVALYHRFNQSKGGLAISLIYNEIIFIIIIFTLQSSAYLFLNT